MRNKKLLSSLLLAIVSILIALTPAQAHPGRTAADGCHYCRTNCDDWGVPYNQRHCHGGSNATVPNAPVPTSVSTPAPTTPIYTPVATPKLTPKPVVICSASADYTCPSNCTAGNDSDCCAQKAGYAWYDNWGCYPVTAGYCTAERNNTCNSVCTAGNDVDCCLEKPGYTWFENRGCYPQSEATCSAQRDYTCSNECTAGNDYDCCLEQDGYTWYPNWGCYPVE